MPETMQLEHKHHTLYYIHRQLANNIMNVRYFKLYQSSNASHIKFYDPSVWKGFFFV